MTTSSLLVSCFIGTVVRRAYLTFDATLGEKTFGRLRFETNQSGEFETYTFKTQVKDLYLGWNLDQVIHTRKDCKSRSFG